jgi:hypothetical protein
MERPSLHHHLFKSKWRGDWSQLRYICAQLIFCKSSWRSTTDIHYRLQYVVRNFRNRGDPFSLRQTGVYHKFSRDVDESVWIILHPSADIQRRLRLALQNIPTECRKSNPMLLHLVFISSTASGWDQYIEHLRLELESFVIMQLSILVPLKTFH